MIMDDIYECRDKQIVPFLLTQQEINFIGIRNDGGIIYFRFSSSEKCQKLVNDFTTRKAPVCQPKDLLDAVESFKRIVFETKGGGQ